MRSRGWREPLPVDRVRRLLEIVPGERRLLSEFGCSVHRLSDPGGAGERAVASALIEEAIERWLPDVELDRADVLGCEDGRIQVELVGAGRRARLEIRHRRPVALAAGRDVGRDAGRDDRDDGCGEEER